MWHMLKVIRSNWKYKFGKVWSIQWKTRKRHRIDFRKSKSQNSMAMSEFWPEARKFLHTRGTNWNLAQKTAHTLASCCFYSRLRVRFAVTVTRSRFSCIHFWSSKRVKNCKTFSGWNFVCKYYNSCVNLSACSIRIFEYRFATKKNFFHVWFKPTVPGTTIWEGPKPKQSAPAFNSSWAAKFTIIFATAAGRVVRNILEALHRWLW